MILPKLYLASRSPRRQELLSFYNIPFELIESPYKEKTEDVINLSPDEKASKLAGFKAFYAAGALSRGIVIGADTIVAQGDTIFGKPNTKQEAIDMLYSLSDRHHKVITGLALVDVEGMQTISHAEVTDVFFRKLSKNEIEDYVNSTEPYDKAGAYAIQGRAAFFVKRIEGCYFNVVGFPLVALKNLFAKLDVQIEDYMKEGAR